MATAFIGLPVLVKLRTAPNDCCRGVLSSLDPAAGTLTLTEARSTIGGVERLDGIRLLAREEVAGLELLSVDRGAPLQTKIGVQGDGVRRSTPQQPAYSQPMPSHLSHSPAPSPSPHSGSPRSAEHARKRGNRAGRRKQEAMQRALQPDDEYPSHSSSHTPSFNEDFDFGAGLATFDKAAVFDQIRSHDDTDPALRLVAHNRNPSRTPQTKMLPTESVLSPQELYDQRQEALSIRQLAGREAKASMTPTDMSRRKPHGEGLVRQMEELALGNETVDGPTKTLLTGRGVSIPAINAKQWKEALSIAEIESAPTTTQRLEASAIALTAYILSHISLSQNLLPVPSPPHSRPSICLLCTDAEKGYLALRAGATLANRGCRVVALLETGGEGKSEAWRTAVRVLSSAGGRIVRDATDLAPTYNLVVDALAPPAGSDGGMPSPRLDGASTPTATASSTALSIAAADWAENADTPLVSLDVPFGINPDTGSTLPTVSAPIRATHILSFGLPRAYLLSSSSSTLTSDTHIALADVGFSPNLWERVGVEDFDAGMWGAESVVELRRA